MRGSLVLAVALLSGCFSANTSGFVYTCGGDSGSTECPRGTSCIENLCQPDGTDLAQSPVDAAVERGCVGTGSALSGKAWACAGPFAKGEAPKLCSPGWAPCRMLDAQELSVCKQTSGFFIAQSWQWTRDVDRCDLIDKIAVACSQVAPNYVYRSRMGCGKDEAKNGRTCDNPCQGFDQAINCMRFKPPGYTCGMTEYPSEDVSTVPEIGALCCKQ